LRIASGAEDGRREHGDGPEYQSPGCEHACLLARPITATLPIDRCKVRLLMPHSISPILRCH
jgi:hypothetical protein